ncbi:hypothetical protein [Sedimentibacter sp.]|uniref:rolling circle replication-associated protein n=1 Tax=Sedimentibacter sp. TaxID=1960295 RepID=UPI0028A8E04F|nr:hypothetical protein [Sedimentibacter sp.]
MYNVKRKVFANGESQIIVYSSPIVTGFVSPKKGKKVMIDWSKFTMQQIISRVKLNFNRSARRSKNTVWDIALSNTWEWFVTLTFNPEKVDSFNYEECTKKLSKWLNNARTKCGEDFMYIMIPELHKSGRFHFHGLLSNADALRFVDSGHKMNEDIIYNIGSYKLGFTTATKVKDTLLVGKYIAKYITKELTACTKGKRRYWASRNCFRPEVEYVYASKDKHLEIHDNFIENRNLTYLKEQEKYNPDGTLGYIRYYNFSQGGNEIDKDNS